MLRRLISTSFVCALATVCACNNDPGPSLDDDDDVVLPPDVAENCPPIFAQDVYPTYHVDVAPAEMAALEDEFAHKMENDAAGLPDSVWHPATFTYKGQTVPNVMIKLKGSTSWLQTIQLDEHPKMQFVIAFNEIDPEQRFMGVRKIELDMPRSDESFLRQRLALYALRQMGLPAQCANHAKLFLNGEYYGLYTNLERMDKEFLQLRYPGADDGDLWKGGRIIKTNEDTFSWDHVDALWHMTSTVADMDGLVDMDAALAEWAGEAVIGDADGYYNGRANFYLYDHPQRGFIWIPQDLDTAFAEFFLPHDASLVLPLCMFRWEPDWKHYLMVMGDAAWQERYVGALRAQRAKLDVGVLQERVDRWSAQVRAAADADYHRPFDMATHDVVTQQVRDFVSQRADFVDSWLACRTGGGADEDGDGFPFCRECNDHAAGVNPNAVETCNGVDDNCDGHVDNLAGGGTCQ